MENLVLLTIIFLVTYEHWLTWEIWGCQFAVEKMTKQKLSSYYNVCRPRELTHKEREDRSTGRGRGSLEEGERSTGGVEGQLAGVEVMRGTRRP